MSSELFIRLLALTFLLATGVTASDDPRLLSDSLGKEFASSSQVILALDSTSTLRDYLAYAAANSPALKAAFYRWRAAVERSGYAGALPDPVFDYTRVASEEHRFGLHQSFPWFGALGAREDIASEEAGAALEKFQVEKLRLFYRVKAAYYEYYFLGRDVALTRDNLALLTFWESVVRTRYKVALTSHPDVIKAQVELGELENYLMSLEDRLIPARARLQAVLGVEDDIPLRLPEDLVVPEIAVDREAIIERALTDNPDLAAALHEIDKQHAAVRLAQKMSRPEFSLGVDYIATGDASNSSMSESGKDPWMVNVGISLPIWFGKNRSMKDEAAASLRQAQYDYQEQKNLLAATASYILFEYADALRQTRLYRDGLVPKAEQALNAGYTAYQAGELEFMSVLDAQRQLLSFQRRLERSKADLAIRQAEIEMIIGQEVENFAMNKN